LRAVVGGNGSTCYAGNATDSSAIPKKWITDPAVALEIACHTVSTMDDRARQRDLPGGTTSWMA